MDYYSLQNLTSSDHLVKEVLSKFKTIFGYAKAEDGSSFEISKMNDYQWVITFMPNGCPDSIVDLMRLLQTQFSN